MGLQPDTLVLIFAVYIVLCINFLNFLPDIFLLVTRCLFSALVLCFSWIFWCQWTLLDISMFLASNGNHLFNAVLLAFCTIMPATLPAMHWSNNNQLTKRYSPPGQLFAICVAYHSDGHSKRHPRSLVQLPLKGPHAVGVGYMAFYTVRRHSTLACKLSVFEQVTN